MNHLRQVFGLLQAAGLRINSWKSKLGFRKIEYLGYTVGQGQLKLQKKKEEAILKRHPTPDQGASQAVFGTRWLLQPVHPQIRCPGIAADGYAREEAAQEATLGCQGTGSLRRPLTYPNLSPGARDSRLYPALPRANRRLRHRPRGSLSTEASWGGTPIIFISRKLQPTKQMYSTIEQEALAVK